MSVLLCIQELPECVKFYQIEPTTKEIALLKKAHGNFINLTEMPKDVAHAVLYILAAASDYKNGWDGIPKAVIGKWAGCRVDESRPAKVSGRLVITGMAM
jgi:hypothetical protein